MDIKPKSISIEVLDECIVSALTETKTANTRRIYKLRLDEFREWYAENPQPVSKALVTNYIGMHRLAGRKTGVLVQMLCALKKLCQNIENKGEMNAYVIATINDIEPDKYKAMPKGRKIDPEEIEALFEACKADGSPGGVRDAAIIAVLHSTGMRRGECVGLTMHDYDPISHEFILKNTKNHTERKAFLNNGAWRYLEDWLALRGDGPGGLFWRTKKGGKLRHGEGLGPQGVYTLLSKREREAGLEKPITPHDFRRTFITTLLDQKVDIQLVAKVVGHSDSKMVALYDQRTTDEMRRAASKVYTPYVDHFDNPPQP